MTLKVAYFSPLPPARSGISGYSARLLAELAAHGGPRPVLFSAQGEVSAELTARFEILDYGRHPRLLDTVPDYDLAVYHIGNNLQFHGPIYDAALQYPGLVVLHDYVLHHLLMSILLRQRKDREAYARELEYCHGADGKRLAEQTFAPLRKRLWESDAVIDYPLNDRLVRTSRGVVVHSRFAEQLIRRKHPAAWLRRIECIVPPQGTGPDGAKLRSELGIPRDALLLGSFGFMTRTKRIPTALAAAAANRDRFNVHYLLVGEVIDRQIVETIERLDLGSRVHITGYTDENRYAALMRACDICVNLRFPTMGETSAVLCQCLLLAKPCIVTDVGWYAELPDDSVCRIRADADETVKLAACLAKLAARPEWRRAMGRKGRAYVTAHHATGRIAASYLRAFRDLAG